MGELNWLTDSFAEHRSRLHAVAYRMLGSPGEAEDAVQEAWLRVSRADVAAVDNLAAWLTTVVARVCLNMLEARRSRREDPVGMHPPEAADGADGQGAGPENEILMADSIGQALLLVLDALTPAERLAFVLHDIFDMPFGEIATVIDRSPAAARQLASRARRRIVEANGVPQANMSRRREVISAFLNASRSGDFGTLVELLAPDAEVHADPVAVRMGAMTNVRGAEEVARTFTGRAEAARLALVNGTPAAVWAPAGMPRVVFLFAVSGEKITGIDLTADPDRLGELDIVFLTKRAPSRQDTVTF